MELMASHKSNSGARLIACLGGFAVCTAILLGGCVDTGDPAGEDLGSLVKTYFEANPDRFKGDPGESGESGGSGDPGIPGLACWDLNGNGTPDPEEDINLDGKWDSADCEGPAGQTPIVHPGQACWDLNGNGLGDTNEDINGDGLVNLLDCKGLPGSPGEDGDAPDHEWIQTSLRFKKPDGTWGILKDLQGPPGDGDITAVLTSDGSGLEGGAESGNVELKIALAGVTLERIDASDASDGKVLKTNGTGMYWGTDLTGKNGGVTSIDAGNGLTQNRKTGDVTLDVGAGTGITVNADDVAVDTGWADARYVNEGQQNSISSLMIKDNAVGSSEIASRSVGLSELDTSAGSSGLYLKHTGGGMEWATVDGDSPWQRSGSDIYYNDGGVEIGDPAATWPIALLDVDAQDRDGIAAIKGVHTDSSGQKFGVFGESNSSSGVGVWGVARRSSGTNYGVFGISNSSSGFDFYAGGAGTNYGSSSSRRWKSNIENIDRPLEKIAQLRGVYFDWDDEHGGHHDVGMIAEEVGAILPEIVNYEENGIDAIGMDYSKLTPLLVEAVNGLKRDVDRKDAQIEKLTTRLERMEARIVALEAQSKLR